MLRTKTTTCHSQRFGIPLLASTKERSSWRSRPPILRTSLALGLGLLGLTGISRDAHAAFTVTKDFLWERRPMTNGSGGCRIPFTDEMVSPSVRNTAYAVIDYMNRNSPCRWEWKQPWDVNYVAVREEPAGPSQWLDYSSSSGGTGNLHQGRQAMSICHGCDGYDHLLHEMGHVMGLKHEHQRPDRDNAIDVFHAYYQIDSEPSFRRRFDGETFGFAYDHRSIMHYDGWDFMEPTYAAWCAFWGCRTMKTKDGGDVGPLTANFTAYDSMALQRRYPSPARLTAMHSGKCVALSQATSQAFPVQWDCNEEPGQGWLLQWQDKVGDEDFYTLETAWPGGENLCLDVQWASQTPGTPVFLWECHGGHSQQWARNYILNSNGYIMGYNFRARHSNQCLTVAWTSHANGAWIIQYPCENAETQIWGLSYRPTTPPPPVDPCVPGQRSICEYDVEARRMICECLP
jgi:hypothetical protein